MYCLQFQVLVRVVGAPVDYLRFAAWKVRDPLIYRICDVCLERCWNQSHQRWKQRDPAWGRTYLGRREAQSCLGSAWGGEKKTSTVRCQPDMQRCPLQPEWQRSGERNCDHRSHLIVYHKKSRSLSLSVYLSVSTHFYSLWVGSLVTVTSQVISQVTSPM